MNKTPLLLVGALTVTGCGHMMGHLFQGVQGSGTVKTESRHIGAFTKIRAEGSMDIEAKVGPASDLKITADDNIVPLIKTRIDGDTLVIRSEGGFSTHNRVVV